MLFDELLDLACDAQASDMHLSSGVAPILRVGGGLERCAAASLTPTLIKDYVSRIFSNDDVAAFQRGVEVDGAFSTLHGRWRAHAYHNSQGGAISLRRLPLYVPALEELGLPEVVRRMTSLERGLVLITGPTGSGKSTTAASMLGRINQNDARHIVTIEDPIEFLHQSKRSLVSQRQVGAHTASFADALRAALREDPDVIFVGEMRDLETIRLALQAAETGHLVISTLHTSSASKTIARIIDVFPAEQQAHVRAVLSETLEGVIAQELVPAVGKGMVVVSEVLVATPAVRSVIRDGKTHQLDNIMQTSLGVGMQSREACLRSLQSAGMIKV